MFRRCLAPLRWPRRSAARLHPAYRSSIAFRSARAAAGLPAARPFFARIACARAPAFAPARFARLIARANDAGRTSPVRSVGGFSRRCEARDEAASGCRFLFVSSYHGFTGVKPLPRIISYFMNELLPPGGNAGTCHAMSCSADAPSQFELNTLSPMSIPCLREFPDMSLISRTAV